MFLAPALLCQNCEEDWAEMKATVVLSSAHPLAGQSMALCRACTFSGFAPDLSIDEEWELVDESKSSAP
jgi:hypothetical protein